VKANKDNVISLLKKHKLLLIVSLAYLILVLVAPDRAREAFSGSLYYLVEMLQVLPIIFLLTIVIEALVPKELIVKGLGEKSGIWGYALALLLGSISAGPVYAAFPLTKMLHKKGASIANVVVILSAWAVIKIPMLANEAKFLGVNFMILRWILTVISIFLMAFLMGKIIRPSDLPIEPENTAVVINPNTCIGCEVCLDSTADLIAMIDHKAMLTRQPIGPIEIDSLRQSSEKCPVHAIHLPEIPSHRVPKIDMPDQTIETS